MVDANMRTAHMKNGVLTEKFHFGYLPPIRDLPDSSTHSSSDIPSSDRPLRQLSMLEILDSSDSLARTLREGGMDFPGLLPLLTAYAQHAGMSSDGLTRLAASFELLRRRANGKLPTAASYMREKLRTVLLRRRAEGKVRRAKLSVAPTRTTDAAAADARAQLQAAICEVVDDCRLLSAEAASGSKTPGPRELLLLGELRCAEDAVRLREEALMSPITDAAAAGHSASVTAASEAALLRSERLPTDEAVAVLALAHKLRASQRTQARVG
mmetsp:Transcript_3869/g.9444  ORF Transcript_3869/g.9444 Transcript_3869/m.9444 type:complete len:269 (-) Transcript_3869:279-1085(-)